MRWSLSSPSAEHSTDPRSTPAVGPVEGSRGLPLNHPPVPQGIDECPVSPEARSVWLSAGSSSTTSSSSSSSSSAVSSSESHPLHTTETDTSSSTSPIPPSHQVTLGTTRVISSIPRGKLSSDPASSSTPSSTPHISPASPEGGTESEGRWVYPSEQQFFNAMLRKNHKPKAEDMKTVVPIHNAVNEKAWEEVLAWEAGMGGERCGGVRLSSFVGRPKDRTPKAWMMTILGYTPPFDRHDWIVDRCGTQIRYVIDFYTGRSDPQSQSVSFYLDVRPALDNWEGVRTRMKKWWS